MNISSQFLHCSEQIQLGSTSYCGFRAGCRCALVVHSCCHCDRRLETQQNKAHGDQGGEKYPLRENIGVDFKQSHLTKPDRTKGYRGYTSGSRGTDGILIQKAMLLLKLTTASTGAGHPDGARSISNQQKLYILLFMVKGQKDQWTGRNGQRSVHWIFLDKGSCSGTHSKLNSFNQVIQSRLLFSQSSLSSYHRRSSYPIRATRSRRRKSRSGYRAHCHANRR